MLTALISFLGSTFARTAWGEVSAWFTARQDHRHELERLRLQGELDAAQHARNLEAIKVQADMGVKVIEAQREADIGRIEADGWLEGVRATGRQVGVAWVDAWNGMIRPAAATWSLVMLTAHGLKLTTLDEPTLAVCGAALGLYLATRDLFKRGR